MNSFVEEDASSYLTSDKDGMNVLYTNINSLPNKRDELLYIINKYKPKIIALSEILPKILNISMKQTIHYLITKNLLIAMPKEV